MNQTYHAHRGWTGRLLRVIACALLLAALAAGTALAADYPYETVTNSNVNMRRSASSSSVVLERLDKGDEVLVLGESGNYYRVSYKNRTGYIVKKYLVEPGETQAPETVSGYPYQTTTKDSVNLRAQASTSSTRLGEIPEGAAITVNGVTGQFANVTWNGKTGYAMTAYINVKTVVSSAAPTAVPTAVPPADSTAALGFPGYGDSYVTLQKGDTGVAVMALQGALKELGFLTGTVDGKFGSGTQTALIAFQKANDYPETGVADANLQAFIYNSKPRNASGKKVTVTTLAPLRSVVITLNDTGDQVCLVQQRLSELGYYTGKVTGVYDSATRKAVLAFQKKHKITADGKVGEVTQMILFAPSALSANATATPSPTPTPKPTPTPTAVPTYEAPGSTVRRGSTGNDAKLVQKRLKELGYYTGRVDGKFWDESVDALKDFQRNNGLEADGVAGAGTNRVLFHYSALSADATATPAPTKTPAPAGPTATPAPITQNNVVTIRLGVKGTAVSNLQTRLTALGYYEATVDGVCKTDDVAAIKMFQQVNGLTVDGVAGYGTQSLLYSPTALTASGAMAGGTAQSYATLRKGMSGQAVMDMQKRLIALGYLSGEADGKYGTNTAEAVYNFQKANGLVRDGIAGGQTLSILYSNGAAAATPKPTATPKPSNNASSGSSGNTGSSSSGANEEEAVVGSTVRQGDKNEAVRALQTRLIELGYLSGKADGVFGIKTYRALTAFQAANGLTSDGIAGQKTWNKISSGNVIAAGGQAVKPSPTPTVNINASQSYLPRASAVQYANWYNVIRPVARKYPYATVYDFQTGISWQVHMFSLGAHADSETVTAADTQKMLQAFGGHTWNPRPVWVVFADGSIYIATLHSMEHGVEHNLTNDFDGHFCIHFPRTASQVAAIGPYATSHQKKVDEGWAITQAMIR